jgi:hypothetical protein
MLTGPRRQRPSGGSAIEPGLGGWTPIRLDFTGPAPAVEWADLSAARFTDPFFDQTVARWAAGPHARPVVRTGLDELEAMDGEPSLDPAGMIFHLSRCGSTLVSRLLGTVSGVVVVAEPAPLNALLGPGSHRIDDAALARLARLVVRALGRRRNGDERQLVLKCTSWNVRRRSVLAAAFPETPWLWVQRDPTLVVASLLAKPPGWLDLRNAPADMTRAELAARTLEAMLEAAASDAAGRLCVDHAELPAAVWQRVAPHFGIEVDAERIERMAAESRFYAKDSTRRVFAGDQQPPLTDAVRRIVQRYAEPGYRALSSR